MENQDLIFLLRGAALTTGGIVALRGSKLVGVRAVAASAVAAGAILLFTGRINAFSTNSD